MTNMDIIRNGDIDDIVEEDDFITTIPTENVDDQNDIITFGSSTSLDDPNVFGIGKVFKSIEEVQATYEDYAASNGFSIRRRSSYKSVGKKTISRALFCCTCEGLHEKKKGPKDSNIIKRRGSTMRSGCDARMRVRRLKNTNSWAVTLFYDKHNHAMVTPSQRILMKSRRNFPIVAKNLTETFQKANIPVSKIKEIFGGGSNVPFDKRDVWNHARNLRSLYEEGDAEGVKNYFKRRAAESPTFFYAIQCDGGGRATNFFWVDSRSRMAYSQFGDAVTFDTTYKTNKYSMPFAPFTGINHHRQSILFGCALLQNEVEDTFIWLFETWLQAMGGKPPISIITDQDLAMKGAIAKVFPTTRHRLCLWHIKKKFGEKLSHVFFKKSEFKQVVKRCTRGSRTIKEFEEQWDAMLLKFGLEDNNWLKNLYEIRESWIPVYCRSTFFAGMNTTQRSESINSFFNGFVTSKTNLREFAKKYDQAIEDRYVAERKEDYISVYKQRVPEKKELILSHAASTYTRNMFDKFCVEFDDLYLLGVDETGVDEDVRTYLVHYRDGSDEKWVITYNLTKKEGSCECHLFEFFGLPCKHLMKLFDRLNYNEIPPYFINKRWVKGANRVQVTTSDGLNIQDNHVGSVAARVSDLTRRFLQLTVFAGESELGYKVFSEILDKAYDQIEKINNSLLVKENDNDVSSIGSTIDETYASSVGGRLLLDPRVSQTKGRKRDNQGNGKEMGLGDSRIKGWSDLSNQRKKPRICRVCMGTGHDSRNCKKKEDNHTQSAGGWGAEPITRID